MIILTSKLLHRSVLGITLFPFILVRDKSLLQDKRLINHEYIHIRQQVELLVLPFYVWYLTEFLVLWAIKRNKTEAYRSISFEREAYANDADFGYLKRRRFWAFLQYFSLKK